jgi:anti-sigma B factor antagonist
MNLTIAEELLSEKCAVLTLIGRLDATTAPDLKTKLRSLTGEGYIQLVMDLTKVPFIDSSGLAALVSGLKTAREAGGSLKLVGLNEQTRTAFRVTLLDRVFEFYPDVDAALAPLVDRSTSSLQA